MKYICYIIKKNKTEMQSGATDANNDNNTNRWVVCATDFNSKKNTAEGSLFCGCIGLLNIL